MEVEKTGSGQKKNDKRPAKVISAPLEIPVQFMYIIKKGIPYLLVVRKNQVIEVYDSFFAQPIFLAQIQNFTGLLPHFGKLIFQFEDKSIAQAESLDKLLERTFISEAEYYKDQTLLPDQKLHFYNDMVSVNQCLFLLRDNVVTVYDPFHKETSLHMFKQRVIALQKLKQTAEDEHGFKHTAFKVFAINRNGTMAVFEPSDKQLMRGWESVEVLNTPMFKSKDYVLATISNQNTNSFVYVQTLTTNNEESKVY